MKDRPGRDWIHHLYRWRELLTRLVGHLDIAACRAGAGTGREN
jgi:hypothetical protein